MLPGSKGCVKQGAGSEILVGRASKSTSTGTGSMQDSETRVRDSCQPACARGGWEGERRLGLQHTSCTGAWGEGGVGEKALDASSLQRGCMLGLSAMKIPTRQRVVVCCAALLFGCDGRAVHSRGSSVSLVRPPPSWTGWSASLPDTRATVHFRRPVTCCAGRDRDRLRAGREGQRTLRVRSPICPFIPRPLALGPWPSASSPEGPVVGSRRHATALFCRSASNRTGA